MGEQTYTVAGTHYGECQANIEMGLPRLDGVRDVKGDHREPRIWVRLDEHRLGEQRLADNIERFGYSPVENRQ